MSDTGCFGAWGGVAQPWLALVLTGAVLQDSLFQWKKYEVFKRKHIFRARLVAQRAILVFSPLPFWGNFFNHVDKIY